VNFVGRFEKLDKDFKKILNILNRKDKLIHVNKSRHRNYKDYYNVKTYEIIRKIYKNDFDIFDYDIEDKKYFNISQQEFLNILESKITTKNANLEFLRLDNNLKIQNLNKIIKNKDNLLLFQAKYGVAKTRIQNQLSYKLGQTMIVNSKSILGCLIMPVALLSIIISYKQEQKIYQEKIKKDPSLKPLPLESYPDYQEALKLKNHFSYKLGQALMQANKTWYKGGYIKMWFEIVKLKREFKNKKI
ncbi:alpha-2,3-sialyltransferase, partial [Campylobacter lari]|nr:alpha-2,3-sialyltransferase [Campylobacter lari]